jgi:hypothetical protein
MSALKGIGIAVGTFVGGLAIMALFWAWIFGIGWLMNVQPTWL